MTNTEQKPRVLMLDIDDTLLMWTPPDRVGKAAPFARQFLLWAHEHFEIRWLTYWAQSGYMKPNDAKKLSTLFNIPWEFFHNIRNPKNFLAVKTAGIDFTDPRPFVWLEDGIMSEEEYVLELNNRHGSHVRCNVSEDETALFRAWLEISKKFDIPM